jgi:hypothetical protein
MYALLPAFLPKYIEHQYGLTGGVAAQLGTAFSIDFGIYSTCV